MKRLAVPRGDDFRRMGRAIVLVWRSAPGWSALSAFLLLVQSALPLAGLYLLKLVVDAVAVATAGEGSEAVGFDWILVLIALAAAVTVTGLVARALSGLATEAQAHFVTDLMMDRLHGKAVEVDYGYYEDPRYYDTLHRAQQEAPTRPTRLLGNLSQVLQSGITVVGILILLATLHWLLAGAIVVALIPALVAKVRHSRRLHGWTKRRAATERQASYLGWLLGDVHHAKEVRIFGLGRTLRERFRKIRGRLREERLDLARARSLAEAGAQATASVVVFGSLAFVAYQTYGGALTLGDMVMYFGAVQRSQSLLQGLFTGLGSLYEDNLFLSQVDEFMELESGMDPPPQPRPVPRPVREGLACRGVGFRYPSSTRPVLQDIDLEVRPGEVVALVGPNGSGKTTLVKLLARLYDPQAGVITLDGVDLRDFDQTELRRQFAVVFQDYGRYHLPARDNIWFGDVRRPFSMERIRRAARAAGVDGAIEGLTNQYETTLGRLFPEGEELSVGEWQKVALARAFLSEAELLLVDEPTSALDATSEAEVFQALMGLLRNRATVVVSHRLSTVRMATRIYVLERGRIVESGSHDELMARGGAYARLFGVQAAMYRGNGSLEGVLGRAP